MTSSDPPEHSGQQGRSFYVGMSVAAAITVFVGFAPTYYLRALNDAPPLPSLVHIHGVVFSLWIALLFMQAWLVRARRTDLHRRLGTAGAVLAGLITVVGLFTAIGAVRRGAIDISFLIVPVGSVVVFPALVTAAIVLRRRSETHKRLMLVATAELLSAAVGRWPLVRNWGAVGDYAVTDLFLAAVVIHDLRTRRRVHPATLWSGLFLVASQPLRHAVGGTEAWAAFSAWLTG